MENFIYETPTKVYFGKDEELKVGKIIKTYNPKKVLLHYGGKSAQAEDGISIAFANASAMKVYRLWSLAASWPIPNCPLCARESNSA